ncbi:MAG: FAD synthetase [Halobacteriales archaeon]|jgi:FAD synthetase
MTRVIAQGTFEVLHPGHLHYLRDAAGFGDDLYVIVARRENVTHKDPPVLSGRQRAEMVSALEMVEDAVPGHPTDIFVPVEEIDPDVIVLGHDQYHDPEAIAGELARREIDCEVQRATEYEPTDDEELASTRDIVDALIRERK